MVLHEETVRQLKTRARGGNVYTLVHTVTFTSDIEVVLDTRPDRQISIYDGYNDADALALWSRDFFLSLVDQVKGE